MTNGEPAKKKELIWIAVACGGLVLVGLFAVFDLGLLANQEGEQMVFDAAGPDGAKTDPEATPGFEDLAEARLSMATGEARPRLAPTSLEGVPDWVPLYPGATSSRSLFAGMETEKTSGTLLMETGDGAQAVIDHYTRVFEDEGFLVGKTLNTGNASFTVASINGEREGRAIGVMATCDDRACLVTVNYNGSHGTRRF